MSIDTNNSSLNNLFGSFLNINSIAGIEIDFQEDINTICIDSSLNRIGINTLDPTCSLDISGNDGKIQVNSISCENIDINDSLTLNGIDLSNQLVSLDNSINEIYNGSNSILNIINGFDASFQNIDINNGILRMFSLPTIDNSVNYGLYVDISGFIKIRIDGQY